MRTLIKCLALLAMTLATTSTSAADMPLSALRDPEIVQTFSTLPVQEGGRVKPLSTLAMYRLQAFHGMKAIYFDNPENNNKRERLTPVEWLLISWFRPDVAKNMTLFVVDNSEAITELGLPAKGKRDRYSYNELAPARAALVDKRKEYLEIDAKQRTPVQRIIANLGTNLLDFEMISGHFDFVRQPFGTETKSVPPEVAKIEAGKPVRLSEVLPRLITYVKDHPEAAAPMQNPWMGQLLFRSALGALMSGDGEMTLRLFPPDDQTETVWDGPGPIILNTVRGTEPKSSQLQWLARYEDLYLALPDAAKFKSAVKALADPIKAAASKRGILSRVNLENTYHQRDVFFWAPWFFAFGFVVLLLRWIFPESILSRLGSFGAWSLAGIGTLMGLAGMVMRFIILEGLGPITNLYETMIFIGTIGALFGLVAELITRRGIALAAACLIGCLVLFVAIRFETMEKRDTMQTLQAVLITRFWLLTHVPMINAGYAACMFAAILGMIYVPMRLFGVLAPGSDATRMITRIAYGFVCTGLFLALVGTILGGIWANYSWGRFWGWDPKENGALMICLMCLIILHARLGGYIREIGLHAMNLVLGMIVVFSWFGVNQLGVGLHAYGFTDGVWFWLSIFWASQLLLLVLAGALRLKEGGAKKRSSPPPLTAKEVPQT